MTQPDPPDEARRKHDLEVDHRISSLLSWTDAEREGALGYLLGWHPDVFDDLAEHVTAMRERLAHRPGETPPSTD